MFDLLGRREKGGFNKVIDMRLLACADKKIPGHDASLYDAYCLQRIANFSIRETLADSVVHAKRDSVVHRLLRSALFMTRGADHAHKLMKVAKSRIETLPTYCGEVMVSPEFNGGGFPLGPASNNAHEGSDLKIFCTKKRTSRLSIWMCLTNFKMKLM